MYDYIESVFLVVNIEKKCIHLSVCFSVYFLYFFLSIIASVMTGLGSGRGLNTSLQLLKFQKTW